MSGPRSVQFVQRDESGIWSQGRVFGARTGIRGPDPDGGEERTGVGMLAMKGRLDEHRLIPKTVPEDERTFRHFENGPQGQLFHSTVGKPMTVTHLAVSQGYEHVLPTLLGLAAEHSLRTTGKLPEADPDLSRYSGRMVEHLAAKGLVTDPRNEVEKGMPNRIDKQSGQAMIDDWDIDGPPDESQTERLRYRDTSRAANFTRGLLRGARPKTPAPTGEQGSLW